MKLLPAIALSALLLTGCKADVGTGDSLSAEDVSQKATTILNDKYAEQADVEATVTCEDELTLDTGESIRCVLTVPGDSNRYGVTVSADDEGEEPTINVQVDTEPMQ